MVKRSIGMCAYGYMIGSGYEGKTKELDDIILQASNLLNNNFDCDIEIRYNSSGESGGAWFKDNNYSCKIGITARLASSLFESLNFEEKYKIAKDYDNLTKDIIIINTVIDKSVMQNKLDGNRESKKHDNIEDACQYLLNTINKFSI